MRIFILFLLYFYFYVFASYIIRTNTLTYQLFACLPACLPYLCVLRFLPPSPLHTFIFTPTHKKTSIVVVLYEPILADCLQCGPNAVYREQNGVGACVCMQNYFGDPFIGCRPECLQSTDCAFNLACINSKCVDPCNNACGLNAECACVNHNPMCYCIPGHTGNALYGCHPIPDNGKSSVDFRVLSTKQMSFVSLLFRWFCCRSVIYLILIQFFYRHVSKPKKK